MSDRMAPVEKLEKQIRVLQRKLERSEQHRVDLENQHDRDQHLYRRLHADLEAARREAEIEAALERVRTKAMAMRKPEELSGISETVFTELKALGFTNLRNTEIVINHETAESITSYYYSDYGVTGVIDVDYTTNPTVAAWARDMQRADDAFVEIAITEEEIESWREYRFSIGYVPDPKLDQADTVYYYSYSIGLGALSISSFKPVTAGQLEVLQQFRNVFNLAYQRYSDIARAEAQAREAQVQLALERIRTQSSLMQHSSELVATSAVFHEQLLALEVATEFSYVWLPDETAGTHQFWATWTKEDNGAPVHSSSAVTYDLDKTEPYTAACFAAWESEDPVHVDFIPPGEVADFFDSWKELIRDAEHMRPERFPDGIYYAEGYMAYGCFGIDIRYEPTEAEQDILRRFAVEFERTYTRFLDLKKAEAQAREAETEAALERVRSRTMAMHRSDELAEVSRMLNREVIGLGTKTWGCAFNIYGENESTEWFGTEVGPMPTYPTPREAFFLRFYEKGQEGETLYIEAFEGDACKAHYDYMCTLPVLGDMLAGIKASGHEFPSAQIDHVAYFKYGYLLFITLEPAPEAHDIFRRFARVFEQAYTRFLDLKQAEAQAREAQIEAALERVRARAMAMRASNELLDVIFKIRHEYAGLGLPCGAFWHTRYTPGSYHKALTGIDGQKLAAVMELPRDFSSNPALAAWERGDEEIGVFKFDADAACRYLHHMVSKGKFDEVDPEAITEEMVRENDGWTFVQARTSHGEIGYSLWGETEPSQEAKDVLLRFAATFDLAYRRFEDLQQAEARAREAEIEASLERVRARAMAMHSSDDLSEATAIVFTELEKLGISTLRCGIVIIDETRHMDTWTATATSEEKDVRIIGRIDTTIHPLLEGVFEAWKAQQPFFTYELAGEDLQRYYQALRNEPDYAFPQDARPSARQFHYTFFFPEGALFTFSEQPLAEESIQIFKRFTAVFALTYRRYLDLKKAEEGTREAQIETSLERVRAHAMGLRKSEDLEDVITIIFEELQKLGLELYECSIFLRNGTSRDFTVWARGHTRESVLSNYEFHFINHPVLNEVIKDLDRSIPYREFSLSSAEIRAYGDAIFKQTDLKHAPQEYKDAFMALEEVHVGQAMFNHGFVEAVGTQPLPEDVADILNRFTHVIDLTYTRFLDLKQAENQAREAQIEASLERVRARAMAMHSSDDLSDATAIVFTELEQLGIGTLRCGINIIHDSGHMDLWTATATAEESDLRVLGRLDITMHPMLEGVFKAWKAHQPYYTYALAGEDMQAYYQALKDAPAYAFPKDASPSESHFANAFFFPEGALFAFTAPPLSEESIQIFRRFAAVFGLTYRRYLDLKQAEEQARQAVKRAALDRVRAEIASMRTATDLERITPLIWGELTTLGVSFFRCGVFIIDEELRTSQVFLTTPQGKALAALSLGFDDAPLVRASVDHWRRGAVYTHEWDAEQMQAWTAFLQERGLIENPANYLDAEAPPEHLSLHFVPFTQGMLYVGSADPLNADSLDIVQALADTFAVAYARYEDFQMLENKNREVETAMGELKATQEQLVQSEKMASLGQLTAGIAHEIKNPLNFVNNFAEVNVELTDELQSLFSDEGARDVQDLLNDLRQNAMVIAQHGKRANGIVHAMMQHASGGTTQRELTDINHLVSEHLDLAYHGKRAQVSEFQVRLERSIDESISQLEIVPQEIGRVILNLVGNSFDAVHAYSLECNGQFEPTVSVSTRQQGDQVEIRVSDNGPGIAAEIKDRIFEPFFSTKPTGTGTGLGLSLSYDIIKQGHGGTLTVESDEGKGATFIVTLPLKNNHAPPGS